MINEIFYLNYSNYFYNIILYFILIRIFGLTLFYKGFFTALATEENSLNILMSTLDIHSSDKDQVQKKYKKVFYLNNEYK